ncbi:ATP-binding protein [Planctomyces sp. SH-PL14]|uniref:ATP-binding protein n=1 Tax=Planctomyces sp. SH-PL14 TaxID=1632864 RepID=UPI00078DE078|nr:ATP-binding protein [Planctomyces sp. SH-PL14]AMV21772.1 Autoinducer 2 sensor kinase/phosphatase LuxQ [Planctomyces sp. SH-PL14]
MVATSFSLSRGDFGVADLSKILVTPQLPTRSNRPPDYAAEARALNLLASHMAERPNNVLQNLVEIVLDLVNAGSAGISILEGPLFRWLATAGKFKSLLNATLPRTFSPCGVVLDTSAAQVMLRPARCFPYIDDLPSAVEEVALIPFRQGGEIVGTVWAVHHESELRFDEEDLRLLQSVSFFASAGYQLVCERRQAEGVAERLRKADQELRVSEERLRLALDSAEMGSWNVDASSSTFRSDARARAIFGGDVEGKTLRDILPRVHADDVTEVRAAAERFKTGNHNDGVSIDVRILQEGEAARWVSVRGRVNVEAGSGAISSIDGTISDISERKAVEDRLREIAAELSTADRQKDEFLAMLSHELRNPLAPIRSAASLIRLGQDQPEVQLEAVDVMDRQIDHMVRLVDDLLDVSRVRTGKIELRKARVPLTGIVSEAVERVRPLFDELGHFFEADLPAEPIFVMADAQRISQVVSNLLSNAAKYSERGAEIRLRVVPVPNAVRISVSDTGIGIAEEMLAKVFELFAQVDQTLERTGGGLGIGLSLVRSLVELHHGTVEVRSDGIGHGSEFTVILPAESAGGSAALPTAEVPGKGLIPRKILLVDDNRDSAISLAMILKLQGHSTTLAHDGRAAVAMAEQVRPEVMLVDIGLPGLNGYEVARAVRGKPWGPGVTLIALTGWGRDEDRAESAAAGFDSHLVKPLSYPQLNRILCGIA